MGEIKELEEAREKIAQYLHGMNHPTLCNWDKDPEPVKMAYRKRVDQILNLRGDGWKMAIVGNWSYTNPDGNKYAQVIWQAGE